MADTITRVIVIEQCRSAIQEFLNLRDLLNEVVAKAPNIKLRGVLDFVNSTSQSFDSMKRDIEDSIEELE